MKHKLNSFSGAFEGTTKGLEGIANALKREEPTPPPYIPTGFPCIVKISVSVYNSEAEQTIIESGIFRISDYGDGYGFEYISGDAIDESIGIAWNDPPLWNINSSLYGDLVTINFETFEISNLKDGCEFQWVNPSTLPQS